MENLPVHISILFILTTFVCIAIFYKATQNPKTFLFIMSGWLILQGIVSLTGFYTNTKGLPPRFVLLIVPPLAIIACLFLTFKGRRFIDNLNEKTLTLLHLVRIPVELGLYWLFVYKTIPGLMTFEGRNFDILSGITAPIIFYFGFIKKKLSNEIIITWNIICLALLLNIVINAILAAPFSFQQFAFEQPNIAIAYFPFIWLPCCIVPIVLFSHLAVIRNLWRSKTTLKFTQAATLVT